MKKISDIIGENNLEIIDDTYTMKKVLKICIIAVLLLTMSACQKSEFEKTTHIRSEDVYKRQGFACVRQAPAIRC